MFTSWLLDEGAYAGPEHLDPTFVDGYDGKQGRPDAAEDLALLLDLGVEDSATLLDLGAGTGRFALAAARRFRRVVAVDVSPAMLEFVLGRAAEAGFTNLECVRAGFLTYEYGEGSADAVYTRHALHHLPDFWKAVALDRIARMLRPKGVLRIRDLIFDFQPAEADEVIGRWLDGASEDPTQGYTRDEYAEHLRSEHSTFRWLFEPMLDAAGFDIIQVSFHGSLYGAYTCRRR